MFLCTRPHPDFASNRMNGHEWVEWRDLPLHAFGWHGSMRMKRRLANWGFLDLETPESGFSMLFWRWDFWNSQYLAYQRKKAAEKAQRERENAVELWGRE